MKGNKKHFSIYIIMFIMIFVTKTTKAQYDLASYYMEFLPQSNYTNPALVPKLKVYVGFPALSSINFKLGHSGFVYNDLVTKRYDDSLVINLDNVISKLKDNNYISTEMDFDAISFGFKIKDIYFNFNVTDKLTFRLNYPKDLISLLLNGNSQFIGETASFNGIGADASHYREYGVGVAIPLDKKKLTLGTRVKFLYGKANVFTEKSDISLYTDPSTYSLKASSDLLIHTAGTFNDTVNDFDAMNYLMNKKNNGLAIDLGFNYKLNYKWNINASIIDIGSINWNSNVKSYYTDNASFTFNGLDINDFFAQNDSVSSDPFGELTDSLQNAFDVKEQYETYKTPLTTKFFLGTTYNITYKTKLGVLFHGEIFENKIHPSFTFSFNKRFGNMLNITASYSMFNRSYSNVGFGFATNLGPVQLYMVSDNILGPISPQSTKNVNLHFGINLVFGYKTKKIKDEAMID